MKAVLVTVVIAMVLALAGCKGDPLRDDVKALCRAADVTHSGELVKIGPYVAEHSKSSEMMDLMVSLKNGKTTIDEFIAQARALVAKAGVADCATLDILEGKAKMVPPPAPPN